MEAGSSGHTGVSGCFGSFVECQDPQEPQAAPVGLFVGRWFCVSLKNKNAHRRAGWLGADVSRCGCVSVSGCEGVRVRMELSTTEHGRDTQLDDFARDFKTIATRVLNTEYLFAHIAPSVAVIRA